MSKIAKRIIHVPQNAETFLDKEKLIVRGPLGKNELKIPKQIEIVYLEDNKTIITKSQTDIMLAGTYNSLISNSIKGVVDGYKKILELKGTGYKVSLKGKELEFTLGRSHLDYVKIPDNLKVKVESNKIIIEGTDNQAVEIFALNKIRKLRKPSVYKKSKGIYFVGEDEKIKLKPGKSLNK